MKALVVRYFPLVALLVAASAAAQQTNHPFAEPIPADQDVIVVGYSEFASIPDYNGDAARVMKMVDEMGSDRFFVNDMRGPIYSISYDGKTVRKYLDVNDEKWGVPVESRGREQGMQSFAFHPQFAEQGAPGYGKFYVWTDTSNLAPTPDFTPREDIEATHNTVLLEWTAKDPAAATYDGDAPRELIRFRQPFRNHNGGDLTFNPLARPGDEDFGLLFMGIADGGSGGDPMHQAQDLSLGFGKVFRLDPMGRNSKNGKYGVPASNPFVGREGALGEIYAYGVRNPQRFAWDSKTGQMYVAEIGQNIVEEISPMSKGANLGWNDWEGSFRFISRTAVNVEAPRSDPAVTYPIVEWAHGDPLLQRQTAASGLVIYREEDIPQLANKILFSDLPSGELFYVSADNPPHGGQALRRILLRQGGEPTTLLKIVQAKNVEQGKPPATRADPRFNQASDGRLFLIDKLDGTIRLLGR